MIVIGIESVLLILYFMQVKYNDLASQTVNPKAYTHCIITGYFTVSDSFTELWLLSVWSQM